MEKPINIIGTIMNIRKEIVLNVCKAQFDGAFVDSSGIRDLMGDIIKAVEEGNSKDDILYKINEVAKELAEEYND